MLGKAAANTRRSGNGFWRPHLGRDAAMPFEGRPAAWTFPRGPFRVDFPRGLFRVDFPRGLSAWNCLADVVLKIQGKMTRAK
jgi:hypothetical protein